MNEIITPSEMYWITRLDTINVFNTIFSVIGALGSIVGFFVWKVNLAIESKIRDSEEHMEFSLLGKTIIKITTPLLCTGILGVVFVPDTKQMCAIKVIPALANNQDVQKLGQSVIDLANEWVRELKPSGQEAAR